MRHIVDVLFSMGLFLNVLLFIPQAYTMWRTKSAEGVSLLTFMGFHFIQITAVLHGYYAQDYVLMIGFGLSFITCAMVTILCLRYRK
jgi:MtN3 and saliva related transmembrane protein